MNNKKFTAKDAEAAESGRNLNQLTESVIGAAINVHRALGPGLLESTYGMCLCHELALEKISFERQKSIPVVYKGIKLDCGYRADLIADQILLVEIKAVDSFSPICDAQLLTYLKLGGWKVGYPSKSARLSRGSFIMSSVPSAISAVNLY